MPLSAAQLQTLKTHIAANANVIPAGRPFAGTAINALPNSADANFEIALWYNLIASPTYLAWNESVPIKSIRGAVDISKYTPADNPPASTGNVTGTNDALLYQNRALVCQLKQANAIFLIQGEGTVDATPQQLRQSFSDCMTSIPAGVAGASQNAGWGTPAAPGVVRLAMQRAIRNIEKVFSIQASGAGASGNVVADARGGTTNPDALVYIGTITADEIETARNLP